jgi:hypothetical protein
MSTRTVTIAALVAILFGATAVLAGYYLRYRRHERAYATLRQGTSEAEVIAGFGKPSEVRSCRLAPSWDGSPPDTREPCVKEFVYNAGLGPEQWVVGFDRRGSAINKYHLVSP